MHNYNMITRLYRHPRTCRHKRWLCMILNPHILNVASGAWIGSSNYPRKHNTVPTLRPPQRLFQQALYSTTSVEQDMKRDALQILDQAIRAVDPYTAVRSHFRVLDHNATLEIGSEKNATSRCLKDFDKIVVVSFGKASSAMATAVVQQLNGIELEKIEIYGAVICKDDHGTEEEETVLSSYGIKTMMASHPVPDERSVDAADYALKLVQEHASPKTLVICCISGGGSALFCKPRKGMTLQDLQDVNSALLASGMGIQECNVVRKRLEDGKGGRLAALSYPSLVVTLVLSDVLGDPLDLIASGPTVPDTSTREDAWEIVERYQLSDKLPYDVVAMLQDPELPDSPSPDHPVFFNAVTVLVGNNALAVSAAAKEAESLGYYPVVLGTQIEGEAKEIAKLYIRMALYLKEQTGGYTVAPSLPAALIAGGETTVSLSPNSGKGGRNQELALSAALQLESLKLAGVVLASAGTDGTDGPTDAAGAVVDASTVSADVSSARQALVNHDAYTYFDQHGSKDGGGPLIKTGPTGTNVADICVTLIR